MKQAASILLVIMMGLYFVPPHQPHTCFTHDGVRFHGDCTTHDTNLNDISNSEPQIRTSEYLCYDLIKGDGIFLITLKTVVNSPGIHLSDLDVTGLSDNIQSPTFLKLPEERCNTGPPPDAILLRGPPLKSHLLT